MSESKRKVEHPVEYIKIKDLKLLEDNPRTISKKAFDRLKGKIERNPDFFEGRPCLLSNRTGEWVVFAGNQRLKAAEALGWKEVPCVKYAGLDEEREKELTIIDNVQEGDWDYDILANKFDPDDLLNWGMEELKPFKEIIEDEPAPVDKEQTYSIIGDIYQLGEHRVFCGSFEDDEKVRELFGDKKATCTFTDPPYNVAVESRTTGKKIQNDNMAHEDFQEFLNRAFECVASNMANGGGVH